MTNPDPSQEPPKKSAWADKLDAIRKSDKIEGLYNYASSNTRDTLSYILMIIGIILLFTHAFYGGFIVGLIFGLYFTEEITAALGAVNDLIEYHGMVRSLIFGGLLLALLVLAWPIYIGVAMAVALRHVIYPEAGAKPKG